MSLKRQQSEIKKNGHSQSEFKLPKLLNNHGGIDYLSNRNASTLEDNSKAYQSLNASILNSTILNATTSTKTHRPRYFLDSSIISEQTGKEVAEKMEYINIYEKKKIQQPELQTDFDLNNFLFSKSDKDKNNLSQHYMLQDDLKTYFHVEKKPVYAKINTTGKNFPMKVKVTASEGTYDFFFSFFDPFPDKEKSLEDFPQRKEHLYKFSKPKTFSQWAYICLQSKDSAKVEIKVWFTIQHYNSINIDQSLEKFRQNDKKSSKTNNQSTMVSLQEKLKQDLSEQEKKQLYMEVLEIKQRKFQKLKMQDQQIIDRNKELAANFKLLQKKKEFDHIIHNQRCEEVVRRSLSIQLMAYQEKYQKYITKIINHKITLEKVARQKFQGEVNGLTFAWAPFIYLVKIIDTFQDMIYV